MCIKALISPPVFQSTLISKRISNCPCFPSLYGHIYSKFVQTRENTGNPRFGKTTQTKKER